MGPIFSTGFQKSWTYNQFTQILLTNNKGLSKLSGFFLTFLYFFLYSFSLSSAVQSHAAQLRPVVEVTLVPPSSHGVLIVGTLEVQS